MDGSRSRGARDQSDQPAGSNGLTLRDVAWLGEHHELSAGVIHTLVALVIDQEEAREKEPQASRTTSEDG